jgi:hypothetical protein
MEPVDGAPCFFSGSLTLGGCGLPSTDRLADCFVAGNGKIARAIGRARGGMTTKIHAVVDALGKNGDYQSQSGRDHSPSPADAVASAPTAGL